jgi:hypothetical protein
LHFDIVPDKIINEEVVFDNRRRAGKECASSFDGTLKFNQRKEDKHEERFGRIACCVPDAGADGGGI